jgi:hypothetical protein
LWPAASIFSWIGDLIASSQRRVPVEADERRVLLGSANWTFSGLGVSHELDLEPQDPHAVAAYGSRFSFDSSQSAPG